ncbi:MAG: RES family NAD+ phosphorylase [bacterium]
MIQQSALPDRCAPATCLADEARALIFEETPEYVAYLVETGEGRYWVICRNDPVNNSDPLGLEDLSSIGAAFGINNPQEFARQVMAEGAGAKTHEQEQGEQFSAAMADAWMTEVSIVSAPLDAEGMALAYAFRLARGPALVARFGRVLKVGEKVRAFEEWWHVTRPLGAPTGSIPIAPAVRNAVTKEIQTIVPKGVPFEGKVWRYEFPERLETTWQAGPWNVEARHRYSAPGIGATYGSLTRATAKREMEAAGDVLGRVATRKKVSLSNVLDLRDESVRRQLGVTLSDITGDDYAVTQRIGKRALESGYEGILAPSAKYGGRANLVIFGGL